MEGTIVFLHRKGWGEIRSSESASRIKFDRAELQDLEFRYSLGRQILFDVFDDRAVRVRPVRALAAKGGG